MAGWDENTRRGGRKQIVGAPKHTGQGMPLGHDESAKRMAGTVKVSFTAAISVTGANPESSNK
jgi:hypothetical protein